MFSNKQIDKLGEKLRDDKETEEDLTLLNDFRDSFSEAFGIAIKKIRGVVDKEKSCTLSDRQTKTIKSIKGKLKRLKKTKLSRMQDIRGCRIVTTNGLLTVDQLKRNLLELYPDAKIKCKNDETGYRATHVIIKEKNKNIEIQIRTELQDLWANNCEKYSDEDNDLKYGQKNAKIKNNLKNISDFIDEYENFVKKYRSTKLSLIDHLKNKKIRKKQEKEIKNISEQIKSILQ